MMQVILVDGSHEGISEYTRQKMEKALARLDVDHIKIFKEGHVPKPDFFDTPLPDFELAIERMESLIDEKIKAAFKKREEKKRLKEDYKILTRQFERDMKNKFRR